MNEQTLDTLRVVSTETFFNSNLKFNELTKSIEELEKQHEEIAEKLLARQSELDQVKSDLRDQRVKENFAKFEAVGLDILDLNDVKCIYIDQDSDELIDLDTLKEEQRNDLFTYTRGNYRFILTDFSPVQRINYLKFTIDLYQLTESEDKYVEFEDDPIISIDNKEYNWIDIVICKSPDKQDLVYRFIDFWSEISTKKNYRTRAEKMLKTKLKDE